MLHRFPRMTFMLFFVVGMFLGIYGMTAYQAAKAACGL